VIPRPDHFCKPTVFLAFYAVYDGHGGDKASEFLKDNLHLNFVNQKEELRKGDVCRALKLAFLESDRQFLNLCKQEGHVRCNYLATLFLI
jgi:serine/threonine protein phosphatase PrpC